MDFGMAFQLFLFFHQPIVLIAIAFLEEWQEIKKEKMHYRILDDQ
jgi:hypothetical protein